MRANCPCGLCRFKRRANLAKNFRLAHDRGIEPGGNGEEMPGSTVVIGGIHVRREMAKIQAGTADWHIEELAPQPVLQQGLAATGGLFAKHPNIRLEVEIPDDLPGIVGDHDRLIQVVVNLISNAIKFCDPTHGVVRLTALAVDGWVQVAVADNGIGIAPADQVQIFERFQQAGNTLTDKPQGTGLGLPITREILQRLGGDISVASEAGAGATFTFRIPAVQRAAGNLPATTELEGAPA